MKSKQNLDKIKKIGISMVTSIAINLFLQNLSIKTDIFDNHILNTGINIFDNSNIFKSSTTVSSNVVGSFKIK